MFVNLISNLKAVGIWKYSTKNKILKVPTCKSWMHRTNLNRLLI